MVGFECVEHIGQRAGNLRDVGGLVRRQLVQVLVDRLGRLDLVLDAVDAAMSMAEKARYGLLGGSGTRNSMPWLWGCCR